VDSVAASSTWTDADGVRQPTGDVHAWRPGTNQTVCGVQLSRAHLLRFPHVPWADAEWMASTGQPEERPPHLCRRCRAAEKPRRERERGFRRP
jgi:hypothetical protein